MNIRIKIPDKMINNQPYTIREYKIFRLHKDSATNQATVDILDPVFNSSTNELTFKSDKFSIYVLTYKDTYYYMSSLPQGLRIFAASMISHALYLNGEYSRALGICDAALFSCKEIYPVGMIYLYCVTAMCEISLKNPAEAEKAILTAWKLAEKDELIEPFIELHGLLQGLLESCIRKENPEMYRKISDAVITFSRGWMAVHNPASDNPVTDALTTMEFSIAMLACRDWSNREIAEHIGVSLNTVKHYLTDIFNKLHVKKRDELKNFVLK